MPCRKCKRETPSDAQFCPYCGVSLYPKKRTHKPRTRPNGAGSAYKDGKTWTAQYTKGFKVVERDGKIFKQPEYIRKKGFKRHKDALDYLPELKKLALAAAEKPEKKMLSMKQVYDLWHDSHVDRVVHSTMNCYRAAWKYFSPLHDVEFSDIDLDDLQECVDDCPRGRRTKENMKALAGLLCKFAVPRHQTDMNYAEYINTGNDKKGTRPAFTAEHIELSTGKRFPATLEPVLRQYYAGFLWGLVEWLESPSPKSVEGFLSDLVAALPASLRPMLL